MKKYLYIIIPIIIVVVSLFIKFLFSNFYFLNSSSDVSAAATKTGLVGYWTMDTSDINGATVYDKSGYNRNGTRNGVAGTNNTPQIKSGKIHQALDFDTTDDTVTISNYPANFGTGPMSVAIWFKTTFVPDVVGPLIDCAVIGAIDPGFGVYIYSDGRIAFNIDDGVTGGSTVYSQTAVTDGKWHQVVGVREVSGGNFIRIYIDGVFHNFGASISASISSADTLIIGSFTASGATYRYSGLLDDVRIYNREFSAQEVANLYNSAKSDFAVVAPKKGMVGHWTMDNTDRNKNLIYDKNGLNHGTLIGTTTSTGRIKEARTFNGAADHVDLFVNNTATTTLSPTSQVSVSAWIKMASTGSWSWIVSNASFSRNVTGGYGLFRSSSGLYAFNVNIWATGASTGVTAVVDGKWHHLVGTYDGVNMIAYFDGVPGTPVAYSTPITYFADEILYIGGSTVGGFTYPWNGQIDDVRIYNYGLSAQEVSNLYNSAKSNFSVSAPKSGLVGHWTMDNTDRSRNIMYDKSGLNNIGTLIGTTTSTGRIKEARYFNGASTVSTPIMNLSGSAITIAYWFKGSNLQSAVRQQSGGNYIVAGWSSPHVHILSNDGGTATGLAVGTAATNGDWHHVSMTWQQNTTNGFRSYLDGVLVAQRTSADSPIVNINNNLFLGSYINSSEFTTGSLDDVRIYNRALSAQEISNLYNSAKTNFQ